MSKTTTSMKPRLTYVRDLSTLFVDGPEGWRETCLDLVPGQRRTGKQIIQDEIKDQKAYIERLQARIARLETAL